MSRKEIFSVTTIVIDVCGSLGLRHCAQEVADAATLIRELWGEIEQRNREE